MTSLEIVVFCGFFLILGIGNELEAQTNANNQRFTMKSMTLVGHSQWENWSSKVYFEGRESPDNVVGKKAVFEVHWPLANHGNPYWTQRKIPVTVFATRRGRIWAGPEPEWYDRIYLETSSVICGLTFVESTLYWHDSVVGKQDSNLSLEEVIKRLEKRISAKDLAFALGFLSPYENLQRITNLHGILNSSFFLLDPKAPGPHGEKMKLLTVDIRDESLQLDLKSPGGHYTANLWINLGSRKVVKAVENGKQVFPK